MKLIKIQINEFGRLKSAALDLDEGFQMVFGSNEKGKSTIMAFVRMMLFGPAGSRRKLPDNDRIRYMPWDSNKMGGYIVFESAGVRYRLERQFGKTKASDTIALMNDISGAAIEFNSSEEPGYRLLGLTESEFTNTVFIGQLGSAIEDSDDLLGRLSNLAGSGDARISSAEVDERLRQAQVSLKKSRGSGGKLDEARKELEGLIRERESAVNESIAQVDRIDSLAALTESLRELETESKKDSAVAQWQADLDFLDRYEQMGKRLAELEANKSKLAGQENRIRNGSFLADSDFANKGLSLERTWQNNREQLQQARRQFERSQETVGGMDSKLKAYGPVLEIEPGDFKNLIREMDERKNLVEKKEQELRDQAFEKNRRLDKENNEKSAKIAEELAAARQSRESLAKDLGNIKKDISSILERANEIKAEKAKQEASLNSKISDLEMELRLGKEDTARLNKEKQELRSESERLEAELAKLKSQIDSGTASRQAGKTRQIAFAGGAILMLAGAAAGILVNPLAWISSLAGLLLIFFGFINSQRAANGQQANYLSRMQILEGELRIADSKYHSQEQLYQYKTNNLAQISGRLAEANKNQSEAAEKYERQLADNEQQRNQLAAEATRLEQLLAAAADKLAAAQQQADELRNSIEQQEPFTLDDQDAQLLEQRRLYLEVQEKVQEQLQKTACDNPEKLANLLQEVDNLRSQQNFLRKELQHYEKELQLKENACGQAAAELIDWLRPYIDLEKPEEAEKVLQQLRSQLDELEEMRNEIRHQEISFADRLDNLTWAEWQKKAQVIKNRLEAEEWPPERLDTEAREKLTAKLADLNSKILETREEIAALESSIRHFSQDIRSVSDIDEQISELETKIADMDRYYNVLQQAREALEAAVSEMQNSFGPALNTAAAENLARLTGRRYEDLRVDRNFEVKVSDPATERFREWQYFSGGKIDQIYLALRVAISDQISNPGQRLPLLLDDILIQYDEQRAEAALQWLMAKSKEENQQMVFFSCQERIREKIQESGLPVHTING